MWHKTAPELSKYFTVIVADLRGYGDSLVLPGGINHKNYSKREMAKDMVQLMSKLNFKKIFLLQDMIEVGELHTEWQEIIEIKLWL